MHAGRYRMPVIGSHGGRAAGESRQQENGAECGKKNGSHDFVGLLGIRKSQPG
jgi:hypothetical protein